MSAIPAGDELILPPLREDIQLLVGPSALDGSPTWNIFDPVRNKYFRIGWTAFQLLSRWDQENTADLIATIREQTTCHIDRKDIEDFVVFLHTNALTLEPPSGKSGDYVEQYRAAKPNWFVWLLRNYLFMRIPVVRPTRFFRKTLPYVEPLFMKPFRVTVLICGFLGLYLVVRQWESFMATFLYFFNLQGLVYYFLALVVIKIFHELGHAYMTIRFGCKIPTMGVALMVLMPVLYTDTTDSWRLVSRRQRLLIGAAGMLIELHIALIATFLWSFLPDGLFRSIAFIFATTSWILSIAINTNVLMRFDGYYILSDLWGIENLQSRSFAMGKWKLREILFNLRLSPPERIEKRLEWKLVLYAWAVWVYRLFLFIGIALLVYYFFFKLLGLLLFVLELVFFIFIPVFKEISVWWKMREKIKQSNRYLFLIILCILLSVVFFVPLNTKVPVPAILKSSEQVQIYAVGSGRIRKITVNEGDFVKKNDVLLELESPLIEEEIKQTEKEIEVAQLKIKRRVASIEDLADTHVLYNKLRELESKIDGLYESRDQLIIRSPQNGVVVDLLDNLHSGRWINPSLLIARIIEPEKLELIGVVNGRELGRLNVDREARFLPDEPELDEFSAQLVEIEDANLKNLEGLYLASQYGGKIAVRSDEDGGLIPEESIYKIRLVPVDKSLTTRKVVRGMLYISGKPKSYAELTYEAFASVLIRESGF